MDSIILITIFVVIFFNNANAQIFRYRLCGNSSIFISEPISPEIKHPQAEVMTYPGSSEFSPRIKAGAEAEIMSPVTSDFEVGVEFDFTKLSGYTETAPLYNFFLSRHNPLLNQNNPYPEEALIYDTKQLSILGTTRWYFLPIGNELNIFIKAMAGVAFTGTGFTFYDPFYRVEYNVGVLYARGTRNSDYPKKVSFSGGFGFGGAYKLIDKLDIYIDGTASLINSDIVNGVPNYDYINTYGTEYLQPASSWALTAQVSIGLLYSAIPDRRLNRSNYTKSRRVNSSIFRKRKRNRPFSK